MDSFFPTVLSDEREHFKTFIDNHVKPNLSGWYRSGTVPRSFFEHVGESEWYGFKIENGNRYPMDAWASSLGEGTQDVQKLVIFREFMKRM